MDNRGTRRFGNEVNNFSTFWRQADLRPPGSQTYLILGHKIVRRFCSGICGFLGFRHRKGEGNGVRGREMVVQGDSDKLKIGSGESRSSQRQRPGIPGQDILSQNNFCKGCVHPRKVCQTKSRRFLGGDVAVRRVHPTWQPTRISAIDWALI